ncbi:MAG: DNA repair protein RecN [Clostridia bacterium]|nr:DNA repair protein RecN [Clostridia bacterium]
MITHISIKDFAIIKELNMDLHPGLNIITGETGAGKSIIIEAISMALGSRADTDYVRTGCEKATVTIIIDADDVNIGDILDQVGIPFENPMILQRQISAVGKSICRINGNIVPLSTLHLFCKKVADIHGQYDHQSLLNVDNHIEILDLYGKEEIAPIKSMTADFYKSFTQTSSALNNLNAKLADSQRQKDIMKYELAEIRAAGLTLGEDSLIEEEVHLMQNSEKIFEALTTSYSTLFTEDHSASDILGKAMRSIEGIAEFSKEIKDMAEVLGEAYYKLEDIGHFLRKYTESIHFSPEELDEKIIRLDLIEKLKRKYGGSIESIFTYESKAENTLAIIENADEEIKELERKKAMFKEQFDTAAARLSSLRKTAKEKLSEEITKELRDLHFNDAIFVVQSEIGNPSEKGIDTLEFLISANKGEFPKPLAKVASGGELSRIMLAMKRITSDLDKIPSMIFDEIDSGISGATAGIVGKKLRSISHTHQVLCITHLPQIAAFGDTHYRIDKFTDETSTQTTVTPLGEPERVEELARLLSGTCITEQSRANAKELLLLSKV